MNSAYGLKVVGKIQDNLNLHIKRAGHALRHHTSVKWGEGKNQKFLINVQYT